MIDVEKFRDLVREVGGEDAEAAEAEEGLCLHIEIEGDRKVSLGYDLVADRVLMMTCLSEIDPEEFGTMLWGQMMLRNAFGFDRLSVTEDKSAVMVVRALPADCLDVGEMFGEAADLGDAADELTKDLMRYAQPKKKSPEDPQGLTA